MYFECSLNAFVDVIPFTDFILLILCEKEGSNSLFFLVYSVAGWMDDVIAGGHLEAEFLSPGKAGKVRDLQVLH